VAHVPAGGGGAVLWKVTTGVNFFMRAERKDVWSRSVVVGA
jgi:hypothetical protein